MVEPTLAVVHCIMFTINCLQIWSFLRHKGEEPSISQYIRSPNSNVDYSLISDPEERQQLQNITSNAITVMAISGGIIPAVCIISVSTWAQYYQSVASAFALFYMLLASYMFYFSKHFLKDGDGIGIPQFHLLTAIFCLIYNVALNCVYYLATDDYVIYNDPILNPILCMASTENDMLT
jgi:hypothetical protein